jgi:hypothetical protein
LPSILTIKQKEAQDAINKMNQSYANLTTQINTTKDEGFKPLEQKLKDEADYQKNTLLNAYKDMNDLPKE